MYYCTLLGAISLHRHPLSIAFPILEDLDGLIVLPVLVQATPCKLENLYWVKSKRAEHIVLHPPASLMISEGMQTHCEASQCASPTGMQSGFCWSRVLHFCLPEFQNC